MGEPSRTTLGFGLDKTHALAITSALAATCLALIVFRRRERGQPKRRSIDVKWDSILRRKWESWRATRVIQGFPPGGLHPDLAKLIVVNDQSVLRNEPPKTFELLTPAARQVLAGMTPTISTIPGAMLPSRQALLEAFNQTRKFSTLTEGGRAFTKHAHRCTQAWWGEANGPAHVINERAEAKLKDILENATWRNVFYLPGNMPVCEFRVELGYGARWFWSPEEGELQFRGFLEPPQEGGHEVGWVH